MTIVLSMVTMMDNSGAADFTRFPLGSHWLMIGSFIACDAGYTEGYFIVSVVATNAFVLVRHDLIWFVKAD